MTKKTSGRKAADAIAVYVPSENYSDLFDVPEEPKSGKTSPAARSLSGGRRPAAKQMKPETPSSMSSSESSCFSGESPTNSSGGLKRTKSFGFFSGRTRSTDAARAPTRVSNDQERRSLNHKAANILGVDLDGNVVKSGRKRFSLHRRSFSAAHLF